ncbi:hypothetical protein NITLEN_100094 [Nitrospira lenta]|uniref:Uncharacterized protein n=1 Tax=Nitrospira lenta TaxID=1436998 RepID=A0A330LB42_9BACT|nr:hypothetical protein NITLEN_100094 [Nitrospira lenta]
MSIRTGWLSLPEWGLCGMEFSRHNSTFVWGGSGLDRGEQGVRLAGWFSRGWVDGDGFT